MDIIVNGDSITFELKAEAKLGDVLAELDDLIDKAGSVIISLKIDGEEIEADDYASWSEKDAASIARIEIHAEDASAIRIRALETLLELLALAKRCAEDSPSGGPGGAQGEAADWLGLAGSSRDMRDAFAGLFAADELSFVQLFADIMEKAGPEPDRASRIEISAQADRLISIFGERLAELRSPAAEMRSAALLFDSRSPELADISVLLQTGKEAEAMKTVLFFIEIFNKVIRVIPELRKAGIDVNSILVEGKPIPEFYGGFNDSLRELTEAFEHKDAVLIGDIAEYEILPRMSAFFGSMREALPSS
jgi:hypothetical protein